VRKDAVKIMMIEILGDGGIAHYAYNLLQALSAKGVDVSLYTSSSYEFKRKCHQYSVYPRMFRCANWIIKIFPILNNEKPFHSFFRRIIKLLEYPLNVLEALYVLRRKNISVVHFQSIHTINIIMIILFRLARMKVVYTIHNIVPLHGKLRKHQQHLLCAMFRLCSAVISHTEACKKEAVALYRIPEKKIVVIPHGNYKFFITSDPIPKDKAKEMLGIPGNCSTVLFFGAIRRNKGLDNALLALNYVREKIRDVRLIIAGELREDFSRYQRIIDKHQLHANVQTYFGYVSNETIPLYFWASDLVLLPYHEITQSGVLYVAYAFSKPVVATDLEGFRESIEENRNGYLVIDGDPRAFADKIITVLMNPEKMQAMGEYSRHLSDTKYSWTDIADRTKSVYAALCLD
jgi:glycosyltransferase involved in cell wall biosynthesis